MNQQSENFSHEEKIKQEIEVLKQKLVKESGAVIGNSPHNPLPPEVELAWYNHIYNYEQLCKEAGYTTVYEFTGKPEYKKISEIAPADMQSALDSLLELLYDRGVELSYFEDCYPAEKIYRFIIEELFAEQICLYRGPGGNAISMFCYEEFHPNHEYDLTSATEDWMDSIFGDRKWHPEWIHFSHEKNIVLNHRYHTEQDYSNKVLLFKEKYPTFLFTDKKIESLEFDMDINKAMVKGYVQTNQATLPFTLYFQFEYLWLITHVEMELI